VSIRNNRSVEQAALNIPAVERRGDAALAARTSELSLSTRSSASVVDIADPDPDPDPNIGPRVREGMVIFEEDDDNELELELNPEPNFGRYLPWPSITVPDMSLRAIHESIFGGVLGRCLASSTSPLLKVDTVGAVECSLV
jgi:hypothetical protein